MLEHRCGDAPVTAETDSGSTESTPPWVPRTGVAIAGKRAVVIGRSNIVGTPAAALLQGRNATVAVVHSRTPRP